MANTLDLLSLDEARAAIDATGDKWDARLAQLVTAVSSRIDELCGPVVARPVTEDHSGVHAIVPYQHPVLTVTSITQYQGTTSQVLTAETVGTIPAYGYLLRRGRITARAGGQDACFWPTVRVVYQAGRYATTATVSERFKEAAAITVAHIWRAERGSGTQTFGAAESPSFGPSFSIPNRALELLGDQRRMPGIA